MNFTCVKAKVITDATGATSEIPILLTEAGPLESLVDYLLWQKHTRSTSWMLKVVSDVKMLLTYSHVNSKHFTNSEELFHNFIQRLYSGTLGDDGLDPSGLYWKRMGHRSIANKLTRLTDFSNWMTEHKGSININPLRTSSRYEEIIANIAQIGRKNRAFLGHTIIHQKHQYSGSTSPRRLPKVDSVREVLEFPDSHFRDLINHGFLRGNPNPTDPANIRDVLICILMHGAGFRLSECFHLWICDVGINPKEPNIAQIKIHHPTLGTVPDELTDERGNYIKVDRGTYLSRKHGMRPRNEVLNRSRAGWKDPSLDGNYYLEAFWFSKKLGEVFLHYWYLYLNLILNIPRTHPYAFVVVKGRNIGGLYCIDSFIESHARAVRRIGLEPAKSFGTTPHGHRHAYGRRLMRSGINPIIRQKALHHKSPSSQLIYSTPNAADINSALNKASLVLDSNLANGTHNRPNFDIDKLLEFGFSDVDPDGLYSGPNRKLR